MLPAQCRDRLDAYAKAEGRHLNIYDDVLLQNCQLVMTCKDNVTVVRIK